MTDYNWFMAFIVVLSLVWVAGLFTAMGTGLWIFGRYMGVW